VLGLFFSRPNWNFPTPSRAGECVSPFGSGGGTHSLAEEGVGGGYQFRRRDRYRGNLEIYVLCACNSPRCNSTSSLQ
jgi:hypothetical protein